MAFTVNTDGSVTTDTAEEAVAIALAMRARTAEPVAKEVVGDSVSTERWHEIHANDKRSEAYLSEMEALRPWFGRLTPKQREVVDMRLGGLWPGQIAAQLGITVGTTYWRLDKAKRKLEAIKAAGGACEPQPKAKSGRPFTGGGIKSMPGGKFRWNYRLNGAAKYGPTVATRHEAEIGLRAELVAIGFLPPDQAPSEPVPESSRGPYGQGFVYADKGGFRYEVQRAGKAFRGKVVETHEEAQRQLDELLAGGTLPPVRGGHAASIDKDTTEAKPIAAETPAPPAPVETKTTEHGVDDVPWMPTDPPPASAPRQIRCKVCGDVGHNARRHKGEAAPPAVAPAAQPATDRLDELRALAVHAGRLSERQRAVVEGTLAGKGAGQLAQELGTTPAAIHTCLWLARHKLREFGAEVGELAQQQETAAPAVASAAEPEKVPPGLPAEPAETVGTNAALVNGDRNGYHPSKQTPVGGWHGDPDEDLTEFFPDDEPAAKTGVAAHRPVRGPGSAIMPGDFDDLRSLFHRLTPAQRSVIELFAEGKSREEVATLLAISLGSVVNHISSGRRRLLEPDPAAVPVARPRVEVDLDDDAKDEAQAAVERIRRRLPTVADGRVRSKTIAPKRLSREERQAADDLVYPTDAERPVTRGDCENSGHRPCPFVSCRHHLYLDVNEETGAIKLNFPHLEVWEMAESCSLDVADRNGITLEEVGAIVNLTRERVRQVEVRGLAKIKDHRDSLDSPGEHRGSPLAEAIGP